MTIPLAVLPLLFLSACSSVLSVTYSKPSINSDTWLQKAEGDGLTIGVEEEICLYIEERLASKYVQPVSLGPPFIPIIPWLLIGGYKVEPSSAFEIQLMFSPNNNISSDIYTLDLTNTRLHFENAILAPTKLSGYRECKERWNKSWEHCGLSDFSQPHDLFEAIDYFIEFEMPEQIGRPLSLEIRGLKKNGVSIDVPKIQLTTQSETRYDPIFSMIVSDGRPPDLDYHKYTKCKSLP